MRYRLFLIGYGNGKFVIARSVRRELAVCRRKDRLGIGVFQSDFNMIVRQRISVRICRIDGGQNKLFVDDAEGILHSKFQRGSVFLVSHDVAHIEIRNFPAHAPDREEITVPVCLHIAKIRRRGYHVRSPFAARHGYNVARRQRDVHRPGARGINPERHAVVAFENGGVHRGDRKGVPRLHIDRKAARNARNVFRYAGAPVGRDVFIRNVAQRIYQLFAGNFIFSELNVGNVEDHIAVVHSSVCVVVEGIAEQPQRFGAVFISHFGGDQVEIHEHFLPRAGRHFQEPAIQRFELFGVLRNGIGIDINFIREIPVTAAQIIIGGMAAAYGKRGIAAHIGIFER